VSSAPLAPPPGRLARLGDFAYRRRRAIVLAWVAGLVLAFASAGLAGEWSADYATPGSESKAAAELLTERFPGQSADTIDVVWQAPAGADAAAAQARVDALVAEAGRLEGVGRGPAAAQAQLSPDKTVGVLRLPLTELPGAVPVETGEALIALGERPTPTACASSSAAR